MKDKMYFIHCDIHFVKQGRLEILQEDTNGLIT